MLKPRDAVIRAPAAHDECTVAIERVGHTANIAIVDLSHINVAALGQSELVRCVSEFDLHVERLV